MSNLFKAAFEEGGFALGTLLVFIVLGIISVLTLGTILERLWFWSRSLSGERQVADRILAAARLDWDEATHLAKQANNRPIGRFLFIPLRLANQEPEVFRLALEASADAELTAMQQGEKLLEAAITLAPLLGLLGTVSGLIRALSSIRLGDLGATSTADVSLGIGEALYSTAFGLVVAIGALIFYRFFQGLVVNQAKMFRRAGNELELTYRQFWYRNQEQDRPFVVDENEPPEQRLTL